MCWWLNYDKKTQSMKKMLLKFVLDLDFAQISPILCSQIENPPTLIQSQKKGVFYSLHEICNENSFFCKN